MSKIGMNFHTTQLEVFELIKKVMSEFDLTVITIKLFPNFERELISFEEIDEKKDHIFTSEMIVFCKKKPMEISTNYAVFLEQTKGNLVLQIGEQTEEFIKESTMGTIVEDSEMLKLWKKVIIKLKKEMKNGVWVLNPHKGVGRFYKDHYYTKGAKVAYLNGCRIKPIAGWLEYHLTDELNI